MSNLLTTSRLKAARACARLHHIQSVECVRPAVEPEPLRFGTLIHAALEAWWTAPTAEDRLPAALSALAVEAEPYDRAKAEALMIGYDARWGDDAAEALAIEVQFDAPLVNPETGRPSRTWRLGGKIDGIIRDPVTGAVLIMEHKTATGDIAPGSDYWRRLRMDTQVSTYYLGAEALGYAVEGCMYDVIGKPALRPSQVPLVDEDGVKIVHNESGERVRTKDGKKWRQTGDAKEGYALQTREETPDEYKERILADIAENPGKYFQRGEVVRLEDEMTEARVDTWQTAQAIREAARHGHAPRNPDACVRWGRTCSYFDVCTGAASIDDPALFTRSVVAHPELSAAPDAVLTTPKEEAISW